MRLCAAVATIACSVLMAACGHGSAPAKSPVPGTSSATAVPTAVSATPTATPPPARAPQLKEGGDAPFPADTEVLVLIGSDHGHGGWFHLIRYLRRGNGAVVSTYILTPAEGTSLTGVVRTPAGRLFASECTGMECFYEGGGPKAVTSNFISSTDDGATWSAIGAQQGEWWLGTTDGEHALAYRTDSPDASLHYITVPDMSPVTPPPGTSGFIVTGGERLLWSEAGEPTLVDSSNNVVSRYDLGPGNHSIEDYSARGTEALALIREQRGADAAVTLLGLFPVGASTPGSLWLADPYLRLGPWLNDHTIAVTTAYGTFNGATCGIGPAIIDVTAGTVAPIREPFDTPDCIHVPRVQYLLWAGAIP